jgi:hypothetical protein
MIVHVDSIRMRHEPLGFSGFANGLAVGDEVTIEFWGDTYRVRVTSCRTVPNCVTPYVEMEVL